MSEAIAIALIGGGFTLCGVLLRIAWTQRAATRANHDDILADIAELRQENSIQHISSALKIDIVTEKVDRVAAKLISHTNAYAVNNERFTDKHEDLASRLANIEGRLSHE